MKLAHYKKIIDFALILYQRKKDNISFVKSFDTLIKPVLKAIKKCEKKLVTHIQQSTWSSKNEKLAFWLHSHIK
jgi:hypothetical protein